MGYDKVDARYFGVPTVVQRLPYEVSLANFTVMSGQNRLQRPVGGGVVASGTLKGGRVGVRNVTNDTSTGRWFVTDLETFGYAQVPVGT